MNQKETLRNCVCTRCNFNMSAPRGIDCSQIKCPRCGALMRIGGTGITPVEINKISKK